MKIGPDMIADDISARISPKVLFCQFEGLEYYAYMILSSQLFARGIECEVEIINDDDEFIKKLDTVFKDCEVLAFQCANVDCARIMHLAERIKKNARSGPIVLGGPHPTLNPELVNNTVVDFICVGAGEAHFAEWVAGKKYLERENYHNIVCDASKPYTTIFTTDLDKMPLPDRGIYYEKYNYMRMFPLRRFIFSLGCPYRCSYCYNINFREKYGNYPRNVVFKGPAKAVEEIKSVIAKYPTTGIVFLDDNFAINKEWLFSFLEIYRKEINLPFNMNSSITTLSDDVINELTRSGLKIVRIAMETTNAVIRTNLLHRPSYDNEEVSTKIKKLRAASIRVILLNMFCLPTQTLDDCVQALRFSCDNKVFMYTTIFVPFKGTKIYEYCVANDLLNEAYVAEDMHGKQSFQGEEMRRMAALHDCTFIVNYVPSLIPAIVWLTKFRWFQYVSHKWFYSLNMIGMHIPIYYGLASLYRYCLIGVSVLMSWKKRTRNAGRRISPSK
jgi:radical SAM superfamily enzyme YgiQ (UPF0313 family)